MLTGLLNIYASTRKPVSSIQLLPYMSLSGSALRKEVRKLEDYGFLFESTAPSGRVPTNKGLRYYFREMTAELFVKGTLNLIDSNFFDSNKVKKLLKTLEEKEKPSFFSTFFSKNFSSNTIIHKIPMEV
jgi:transcriptional regulator of heat shock response